MFVVTKNGKKLSVDDSQLDYENDFIPFTQNVGLYDDTTKLFDYWLATFYRDTQINPRDMKDERYEFVAERGYDHEPSDEELLWAMSSLGLSRYDIVDVSKVKRLNFGDNDY